MGLEHNKNQVESVTVIDQQVIFQLAAQLPTDRNDALRQVRALRELVLAFGAGGLINQLACQIQPEHADAVVTELEAFVARVFVKDEAVTTAPQFAVGP